MPDDESRGNAGQSQQIHAGRDGYAAGRDIYVQSNASFGDTSLRYLSKDKGAQRIIDWSREDPALDRPGGLLVSVGPTEAAPALRVVLGRDVNLVVALLVGINEARAKAIITELGPAGAPLERLLDAAEAISECAGLFGEVLGERDGRLSRIVSRRGTPGFLQAHARGEIYWSAQHGARATTGAIADYHRESGGCAGPLGFPVAAADHGQHPRTGTECTWQLFEGPVNYSLEVCEYLRVECGATIFSSEKHGTHATVGPIGDICELGWRDREWQGLPVEDAVMVGPSLRGNEAGTSGWGQRFESGTVYWSDKTGAIRVPRRWAEYLVERGGVDGPAGFPVSPERSAASSPYGTTGHYQRFEGLWDYPAGILAHWPDDEPSAGATIYYSEKHGPHFVERRNGAVYERFCGTDSWLGFPTSDESTDASWGLVPEGTVQSFEGGAIFKTRKHGSVPVRLEVVDFIVERNISAKIGFPIREPEELPSRDAYIQRFEHGLVTVEDGQIQAWFPGHEQ